MRSGCWKKVAQIWLAWWPLSLSVVFHLLIDAYFSCYLNPSRRNSNPVLLPSESTTPYSSPHPNHLLPLLLCSHWGFCHQTWREVRRHWKCFPLNTHWPHPQFLQHFLCWPHWLWFKWSISFLHRWGPGTDPQSCHFCWLLSSAPLWQQTDYNLPAAMLQWKHFALMKL